MARRASSSLNPVWLIGIALLAIAAIFGGKTLFKQTNDPYRTIPELEVSEYLENSNSLRGNVYKVTGTILNSLAWSPVLGRLFSVEVKTSKGNEIVPVLIPIEFNHVNVQKGQEFQLQIEVGDKGVLQTRDIRKS